MRKLENTCVNCANYKPLQEEKICDFCCTYPAEYRLDGKDICETCLKATLKIRIKNLYESIDDMHFLSLKEISEMLDYELEVL